MQYVTSFLSGINIKNVKLLVLLNYKVLRQLFYKLDV